MTLLIIALLALPLWPGTLLFVWGCRLLWRRITRPLLTHPPLPGHQDGGIYR